MAAIRLAYRSRATFKPRTQAQGVEPNVARILVESRKNNAHKGIVGGLYFGNGCFFQCLEGDEKAVRELYQRIQADSRHADVETMIDEPVDDVMFDRWTMKYVPIDAEVNRFLDRQGLDRFDPYGFDAAQTREMVQLLRQAPEDSHQEASPQVDVDSLEPETPERGSGLAVVSVAVCLGVLAVTAGVMFL